MVVLVTLLDTTKNADGIYLVWLIHHHSLESTFQRLILLEVLLILVEGSGTDGSQFTTSQGRLQNVGCIHGTFATASTYQGMNLIDEEDNLAVGIGYLLDDALQTLLELTLVFGTGNQCTHIERIKLLVLQILRYVATDDTLCKSLNDSGFTCTRLTDKDRVVLGSARENLKNSSDFLITTDNRVELAAASLFYQVLGIFFKTLIVLVGTLALHVLTLSQSLDGCGEVLLVGTRILEDSGSGRVAFEDSEEDRLHADEFISHLLGDVLGIEQYLVGIAREVWLTGTLHTRQVLHLLLQEHSNLIAVHAQLLEDVVGYIRCLLDDTTEKMHRFDGLLTISLRYVHSGLHRFLRLDCKFVECHILISFLSVICSTSCCRASVLPDFQPWMMLQP